MRRFFFLLPLLLVMTACGMPMQGGGFGGGYQGPYSQAGGNSMFGSSGGGFGDMGTKEIGGGLLGALAGGFGGHTIGRSGSTGNIAATIGGALLGGFIGQQAGKSLDRADIQYQQMATQRALSMGPNMPQPWQGPNASGQVVAGMMMQTPQGICRQFQQTIIIQNRPQTAVGQACQNPDGSWRIVS